MAIKILLVAGARPNFMKVAPLVRQLRRHPGVQTLLVHTGQHYDPEMSDAFFQDLELPTPDVFLGVGSGSHAEQTAKIMVAFETVILEKRPDAVVVVGDVNSTLACSLVAAKIGYPISSVNPKDSRDRPLIVHVEAGLRSLDRSMPEEINRIVTDALSDLLLTSSRDADENLKREGIPQEKICFVGNVMIDTLLAHRERAGRSDILPRLGLTPEHNERRTPHAARRTPHAMNAIDSPFPTRSVPCIGRRTLMTRRGSLASSKPCRRSDKGFRSSIRYTRGRSNVSSPLASLLMSPSPARRTLLM